jgi:SAM-dependent methyltransferase
VNPRQEGLARLSTTALDASDLYYLHLRSLFSDLGQAAVHVRGRLLDVGCGNKPYEAMFRDRVETHLGCDLVQSSDRRVDVRCPATELPFRDGSFDTVLATQVVEHVADPARMVAEAARVLRPGGVLVLSGPMYWPLHEEPHDYFRFTRHGFRRLVEEAGLRVREVRANGGKWALCGQALLHAVQGTRLQRPAIVRLVNRIFARLDDRHPDATNPINYVVVAEKGARAPAEGGRG